VEKRSEAVPIGRRRVEKNLENKSKETQIRALQLLISSPAKSERNASKNEQKISRAAFGGATSIKNTAPSKIRAVQRVG